MKKSILFKSILAGAVALSTFSAQAGVFTLGRTLFGATAASTLAGMYKGATTNPTNWQKARDYELAKRKRRKDGAIGILIASGTSMMVYTLLDEAAQDSRNLSTKISNSRKRARAIVNNFNRAPRAVRRVRRVMAKPNLRYLLRASCVGLRGLAGTTLATLGLGLSYISGQLLTD